MTQTVFKFKLEKGIEQPQPKEALAENMDRLRETLTLLKRLNSIKGFTKPQGDRELLQQYSEAAMGVLNSIEKSVQHSHWPAAKDSLQQLKKLRSELLRDFRPTAWQRFKFWLKRLFR